MRPDQSLAASTRCRELLVRLTTSGRYRERDIERYRVSRCTGIGLICGNGTVTVTAVALILPSGCSAGVVVRSKISHVNY